MTYALKILRALDGARYVFLDESQCEVYVWFGGRTVNVYTTNGNNVFAFTLYGDDGQSVPELEAVHDAITSRIELGEEE